MIGKKSHTYFCIAINMSNVDKVAQACVPDVRVNGKVTAGITRNKVWILHWTLGEGSRKGSRQPWQ